MLNSGVKGNYTRLCVNSTFEIMMCVNFLSPEGLPKWQGSAAGRNTSCIPKDVWAAR